MSFGPNISEYKNVHVFEADSALELKALLDQIKVPHKRDYLYYDSGNKKHVCWLRADRPLMIIIHEEEKEPDEKVIKKLNKDLNK